VNQQICRQLVFVEAVVYLLLARLVLLCLPYRVLVRFMSIRLRQPQLAGGERKRAIKSVRLAILRASQLLPVRMVCFPRAIAAQAMLRRRGVGTRLYYGATNEAGKGLVSHAWVQDGDEGVIGLRAARGYKVIGVYPE
jgi:hypothetical protein